MDSSDKSESKRRNIDVTPGRVVIDAAADAPTLTSDDVRAALDDYLPESRVVPDGHMRL